MGDAAGRALERQQAAAAALAGRLLRDQVIRKVEIEIGKVHFL